jgi:hypothetical protein
VFDLDTRTGRGQTPREAFQTLQTGALKGGLHVSLGYLNVRSFWVVDRGLNRADINFAGKDFPLPGIECPGDMHPAKDGLKVFFGPQACPDSHAAALLSIGPTSFPGLTTLSIWGAK